MELVVDNSDGREYPVPEEMVDLMEEFWSAMECRDKAIQSTFRAKRAIYYGKVAQKAKRKFWSHARELYPDVKEGSWSYDFEEKRVFKVKGKD